MGLTTDLGPGPVALDTAIFIYLIEEHSQFLPVLLPLFDEADGGSRTLVTSALTLLEVLVVPLRAGDHQLADRYELLLTESRGLRVVDISRHQLRAAAALRAATGMRTPDALHFSSAVEAGSTTFLTNDRRLPNIPGLRVLQLSSYVRPR